MTRVGTPRLRHNTTVTMSSLARPVKAKVRYTKVVSLAVPTVSRTENLVSISICAHALLLAAIVVTNHRLESAGEKSMPLDQLDPFTHPD